MGWGKEIDQPPGPIEPKARLEEMTASRVGTMWLGLGLRMGWAWVCDRGTGGFERPLCKKGCQPGNHIGVAWVTFGSS